MKLHFVHRLSKNEEATKMNVGGFPLILVIALLCGKDYVILFNTSDVLSNTKLCVA